MWFYRYSSQVFLDSYWSPWTFWVPTNIQGNIDRYSMRQKRFAFLAAGASRRKVPDADSAGKHRSTALHSPLSEGIRQYGSCNMGELDRHVQHQQSFLASWTPRVVVRQNNLFYQGHTTLRSAPSDVSRFLLTVISNENRELPHTTPEAATRTPEAAMPATLVLPINWRVTCVD